MVRGQEIIVLQKAKEAFQKANDWRNENPRRYSQCEKVLVYGQVFTFDDVESQTFRKDEDAKRHDEDFKGEASFQEPIVIVDGADILVIREDQEKHSSDLVFELETLIPGIDKKEFTTVVLKPTGEHKILK